MPPLSVNKTNAVEVFSLQCNKVGKHLENGAERNMKHYEVIFTVIIPLVQGRVFTIIEVQPRKQIKIAGNYL